MNKEELKKQVCAQIDQRAEAIIRYAQEVERQPEMGFKEIHTAKRTADFFRSLGLPCEEGLALTGVRSRLKEACKGPNIAVLGELDAVICHGHPFADPVTGAAHACGHHIQLGVMAGVAAALSIPDIAAALDGNVTFLATPAEEFVEIAYRSQLRAEGKIHYFSGKQELIYRGAFDDIDMSLMIHVNRCSPAPLVVLGESSNGFLAKTIQYIGKESHAAEAPNEGINALNAAMLGLMGIHALRETFRDQDVVRVHPIITKGGDLVNSVPADVRLETYVRAKTMDAILSTHTKVDRALRAGGDAIGAQTIIHSIPGYLPLISSLPTNELFAENAQVFLPPAAIERVPHFGGSLDLGDVSHLMPCIHPFVGGCDGALHAREFCVKDYRTACLLPAKILAMTLIDLLTGQSTKAKEIIASHRPAFTKEQYIRTLDSYFS